jgi:stearoyl-CoA desaturase (delta-9 desaturase)
VTRPHRIHWAASIPFFVIHVLAVLPFFLWGFSWSGLALALAFYFSRMIFVTAGYHRYFSHRTFKTSRAGQFVLAFLAQTSAQKGALWWAAAHRRHHRYSDKPEDVHSVRQDGFWWAHVGWILSDVHTETEWERIPDLAKYPELVWLNKWHLVPPIALAVVIALVGGSHALFWGFFFSTTLLWHGTFLINSLAHVIGRRRFVTTDDSRNSLVLALLTTGEGWHNNHHRYPGAAPQGFYWWQIDFAYYFLLVLSALRLVSDVRRPPPGILAEGRANKKADVACVSAPLPASSSDARS